MNLQSYGTKYSNISFEQERHTLHINHSKEKKKKLNEKKLIEFRILTLFNLDKDDKMGRSIYEHRIISVHVYICVKIIR